MIFVEVAVNTYQDPTKQFFTYQVPKGLEKKASEGAKVAVPFGKRIVEGYIWSRTTRKPPFPTKPILEIKEQIFNANQLKLSRWMARYYLATPLECLKCQLGKKGQQEETAPKTKIDTLILLPYASQIKIKALASRKTGEKALIGSRSAVFAQLPNLKKIIIEEPENWNYKDERAPYYHALAVAKKRAEIENLKLEFKPVIPSVGYFAEHFPTLLNIKPANIVDLNLEKAAGNYTLISQELEGKIVPPKTLIIYASSKELREAVKEDLQKKIARKSAVEIFGPELFSIPAKEADYIFWADADTLLNLPDFRAHEKLIQTAQKLGARAGEGLYIQTSTPKNPSITDLATGELEKFYQRELKNRKKFKYPPFSTLVKLTYTSKSNTKTSLEAEKLYETISKLKPQIPGIEASLPYEPYVKTPRKIQLNIAVKIKHDLETEEALAKLSKVIPTAWRTEVDPESLL